LYVNIDRFFVVHTFNLTTIRFLIGGTSNRAWRHWGCTTPIIISNMKKSFSSADELDGFDDLQPGDQDKVRKAWEDGHVADEDIPETARKAEGGDDAEEAKAKKKRAPAKKDDEGEAAKPKKSRAPKKASCYRRWDPFYLCR
jgi:Poly(ADP-ribose) polymerase and DNA-Ligase Zn-finger region